jgi:Anti-sigma-K factor rskA, C-terminal
VAADEDDLRRLARALDTGPAEPPPARVAARRAEVERNRRWLARVVPAHGGLRRGRWPAAAAVLVAVLAGVALGEDLRGRAAVAGTVEYAGTMAEAGRGPLAAALRVVATGTGRVIELDTDVLPVLPRGGYYELWFVAPDDAADAPDRISAGTFHPDQAGRSDVRLAAAVVPTRFPVVEVTAEPGDRDPDATGPVVLRAVLLTGRT